MKTLKLASVIVSSGVALTAVAPTLSMTFECEKMNWDLVKIASSIEDYEACLDNGFDPDTMVYKTARRSALEAMASVSTPEHLAPAIVRLFLERGADPDGVYERGSSGTPLTRAVSLRWLGNPHDMSWEPETTVAVITNLLEYGADPNLRKRYSPLGEQEFGRPPSILSSMRKRGVKAAVITSRLGFTPLMLAVRENEHHSIVEVLLDHGADPNMATLHEDWTSLHIGAWRGNPRIMQALLDHGADPTVVTSEREWTPLHVLAWSGGRKPGDAIATMKLLIEAGVDPAAKDAKGRTAWDIIERRHGRDLKAAIKSGQLSDSTLAMLDNLRRAGS